MNQPLLQKFYLDFINHIRPTHSSMDHFPYKYRLVIYYFCGHIPDTSAKRNVSSLRILRPRTLSAFQYKKPFGIGIQFSNKLIERGHSRSSSVFWNFQPAIFRNFGKIRFKNFRSKLKILRKWKLILKWGI